MSAHVLLNLLNKLGKRDKMRGLPSILSLFRNEFNKFNNTRARMLDSIYHMTNTLKSHFWRKNVIILSLCAQRCSGRHNVSCKSINQSSGLQILLHGVISLPDATSYDKINIIPCLKCAPRDHSKVVGSLQGQKQRELVAFITTFVHFVGPALPTCSSIRFMFICLGI